MAKNRFGDEEDQSAPSPAVNRFGDTADPQAGGPAPAPAHTLPSLVPNPQAAPATAPGQGGGIISNLTQD